MTAPNITPARVVIRAPNWLGDAVLALPAMAAIRRRFPGSHLTVAARGSVAPIFKEISDVAPDEVLVLPKKSRAVIDALANGRFDLAILFPNSFRSAWESRRAGIPARWGFGTSMRGPLLTAKSVRERRKGVTHQSDFYRDLVRGLGLMCDDAPPRLTASDTSRTKAAAILSEFRVPGGSPLVGLAPGAAYGQAKQWPVDRFAGLAARLMTERGATCLLLGAGHDRDATRAIESTLRSTVRDSSAKVIDLAGRTDLSALVGLAARCDVFVSNDSGAMHVAAALGRPVVALFGPTDERATRPLGQAVVMTQSVFCRPCMLRDCPIDHRCMKRITVDSVANATMAALHAPAAASESQV